jgi:hypothetical protein
MVLKDDIAVKVEALVGLLISPTIQQVAYEVVACEQR